MQHEFIRKTGKAIEVLASEILLLNEGDQLPVISDWVERHHFSRGTVQNALHVLRERRAIQTQSRGHLGSYLTVIDYKKLQQFILNGHLRGSMPLPYSRLYEGFASGLYDNFACADIPLSMAYMRGAKERIHQVIQGIYHFSVISALAATVAIEEGTPISILVNFGQHSYLSQHVLLLNKNFSSVQSGMRIGIDDTSYDQQCLTKELARDYDLELIPILGQQIIPKILSGELDAGIWNHDQIIDQQYSGITVQMIHSPMTELSNTAVLIGRQDNDVINTILRKNIDKDRVLTVQKQVVDGLRIPQY
ncbi:GntR family transcriptional regulator YhfZ [Entomospira entomophila]|uniref:GntR family transcriptional regulator n=1 Tax=Entomospira entomophila TaxID=2719988 RepID=A0A968GCU7_9SPIO|nr:GntR family transcriptional regulator YhfZ [Entomospira entomophilus]NIZ40099.1 hypothetical protein [Entomospira entomophilus]WDI35659.1 GntR family transcriptional regulator YhfZ [Entomospira entomophilus]